MADKVSPTGKPAEYPHSPAVTDVTLTFAPQVDPHATSRYAYKIGRDGSQPTYLGKVEFSSRLVVHDSNCYRHDREWKVVRIDRIEPASWTPNFEFIPTVYVSAIVLRVRRG